MTFCFHDKNSEDSNNDDQNFQGTVVIRGTDDGLLFSFNRIDTKDKIILNITKDILDGFVKTVAEEATRAVLGKQIEADARTYIADFVRRNKGLQNVDTSETSDTYKLLYNFYVQGAISDGSVESFMEDFIPLKGQLDASALTMAELLAVYGAGQREINGDTSDSDDDDDTDSSPQPPDLTFGD